MPKATAQKRQKVILPLPGAPRRYQAAIVDEKGAVLVSCGHDDHRTKKDAAQCLDRIRVNS
jgi:hypothetical protein